VVGNWQAFKPPVGECGQVLTFIGYDWLKNAVEGTDAVGGNYEDQVAELGVLAFV
jgi:hypothetical protein